MKIRSYFSLMAGVVVLIPVVLLSLGLTFWLLSRNQEPLPSYDELPRGSEALTDQATWTKLRSILENRPRDSRTFVFDGTFHLIYSSAPLPTHTPGQPLTIQESIRVLQGSDVPRDLFLFQPAGTQVWIVLAQDRIGPGESFLPILLVVGTILLAFLILTIAASLVIGRGLTMSIVRLEAVAQRVAKGDLAFSVSLKGADEVVSLGRALEQMRLALLEENARQSRFVMGVSHDLKSPLALIKGYVELVKDGPPATAEAREAHFDLILDKVDQLDAMIDHLIDYSKVNTGDWQQTWRPVNLQSFLADFCSSLGPDARLLGRSLEADLDLGDRQVTCDARSIRRCLENLVHNALRYTPRGGSVGVRARANDRGLEITVWDDGPGIAAEDMPYLFEQFYRGTHSRREPGMGLGLSIVKTILDSHGWTIRAESDRGARFVIEIPLPSDGKSAGTGGP